MTLKNVLLFYKASAYEIYFLKRLNGLGQRVNPAVLKHIRRAQEAHEEHYASLKKIEGILKRRKISYVKRCRGRAFNLNQYDLIITVGGDGTFLEAARGVNRQLILGVNSNPEYSVGKLCAADVHNFEKVLSNILNDRFKVRVLQRLRLELQGQKPVEILNDILVCHKNPAMMCRYYLQVKNQGEAQRSSGVWIATTAGSSGAIRSAGGKMLKLEDKKFQYLPRELYDGNKERYRLRRGVLSSKDVVYITSLMTGGVVFVDGAHVSFPFPYGSTLKVFHSPNPIKTIKL